MSYIYRVGDQGTLNSFQNAGEAGDYWIIFTSSNTGLVHLQLLRKEGDHYKTFTSYEEALGEVRKIALKLTEDKDKKWLVTDKEKDIIEIKEQK